MQLHLHTVHTSTHRTHTPFHQESPEVDLGNVLEIIKVIVLFYVYPSVLKDAALLWAMQHKTAQGFLLNLNNSTESS